MGLFDGKEKQRKVLAGAIGTQMLMDAFEIPAEKRKEIDEKVHVISEKHRGDPPGNLKELSTSFAGRELAYVMWRMGMNSGIAFSKVFGDIPSTAEW